MTPFRQVVLAAIVALSLLVSFASVASADPGRGGSGGGTFSIAYDCVAPGDGGVCP